MSAHVYNVYNLGHLASLGSWWQWRQTTAGHLKIQQTLDHLGLDGTHPLENCPSMCHEKVSGCP